MIPIGLCQCGCGKKTGVYKVSDKRRRIVKGEPKRLFAHHKMPENIELTKARFWSRVDVGKKDECWLWQAGVDWDGYGLFKVKGVSNRSNRMAYAFAIGSIPADMKIIHSCDNPGCCNPRHLSVGTNLDNARDRITRDRQAKGTSINTCKLTEEQVLYIRQRYAEGDIRQIDLAREFGITQVNVSEIVLRRSWRHI